MSLTPFPMDAEQPLTLSAVARHLPLAAIAGLVTDRRPADGDLALAEVLSLGRHAAIDLAAGRAAELDVGMTIVVAVGRVAAPLEFSGDLPAALGEADLLTAAGAAGAMTDGSRGLPPTRLRLLGLLADAGGRVLNLAQFQAPLGAAPPAQRLAVISCARGCHATRVTAALARGLARGGSKVGVLKPTGSADAAERWRLLDAGARRAVDVVDAGQLCSARLDGGELLALTDRLLAMLAGHDAAVLRIAGGLARRDVRALLAADGFAQRVDGIVLAAADALSAIEAARRLAPLGIPLLAVSGAICRSPLAMREARAGLNCPVVDPQALALPAQLQPLLAALPADAEAEAEAAALAA